VGGSRCEVFDEAMHTRAVNRLKLEAELRKAIELQQLRVHYQPIVQLATRQITGFEALMRWQHPQQGLISPYHFIDVAEDSGLLYAAGHWLILEVCRQLERWENTRPGLPAVTIGVNLSLKQFADPRFVAGLQSALRETGIEPSQLHLEITEPVAATDPKMTINILSSLRQMGIGVTLDDFGTGNSSIVGLRQFPVEALKIDRSLISGMLSDRSVCDTVELIILLAHKLKLKVIAEGIETGKHWEHLLQLDCDLGQGYFFYPPVDPEAASELLRERTVDPHTKATGA
jgi:EAL domain-containing protein (putative c-di-GMP-specific phosphodiesterase class I)